MMRTIDWVKTKHLVVVASGYIFCAGFGGWIHSIMEQEAKLPYLQRSTMQFEQLKKAVGTNPAATITCLHRKADVAQQMAVKSESGQEVDTATIPNCPPLPSEKNKKPH